LLSVPAGGGGCWLSVAGGQDPVYYAAFVSRGGWCKVTVSFLLPPLQPPPVSSTIARPLTGTPFDHVRPHIRRT